MSQELFFCHRCSRLEDGTASVCCNDRWNLWLRVVDVCVKLLQTSWTPNILKSKNTNFILAYIGVCLCGLYVYIRSIDTYWAIAAIIAAIICYVLMCDQLYADFLWVFRCWVLIHTRPRDSCNAAASAESSERPGVRACGKIHRSWDHCSHQVVCGKSFRIQKLNIHRWYFWWKLRRLSHWKRYVFSPSMWKLLAIWAMNNIPLSHPIIHIVGKSVSQLWATIGYKL